MPIWPQQETVPSSSSAHACAVPSTTSRTWVSAGCTGDGRTDDVPTPRWPCPFAPQQRSVATDITAQLECTPTTTFVACGFTGAGGGASTATTAASIGLGASFGGGGLVECLLQAASNTTTTTDFTTSSLLPAGGRSARAACARGRPCLRTPGAATPRRACSRSSSRARGTRTDCLPRARGC